jgi:hypothetical protein
VSTNPQIIRPLQANVREVWPGEAADFTPWLADNLDWLDVLGLGPIALVEMEASLPDTGRSLDILGVTEDGHRIAIENQYGRADHDHLTRGLAYAIGLDTRALVVIAEQHAAEFVAIADYLNTAYEQMSEDDGVAVFLVELRVERVGDAFIPRFQMLAEPNAWRRKVGATRRDPIESVDAFLDGTADPWRAGYKRMLAFWDRQTATSTRRNGQTVGLTFQPENSSRRPRSLFTLEMNGLVWINRDFCREISRLGDDALDAKLAGVVPGCTVVGKGHWWKVQGPEAPGLEAFAAEILAWPVL